MTPQQFSSHIYEAFEKHGLKFNTDALPSTFAQFANEARLDMQTALQPLAVRSDAAQKMPQAMGQAIDTLVENAVGAAHAELEIRLTNPEGPLNDYLGEVFKEILVSNLDLNEQQRSLLADEASLGKLGIEPILFVPDAMYFRLSDAPDSPFKQLLATLPPEKTAKATSLFKDLAEQVGPEIREEFGYVVSREFVLSASFDKEVAGRMAPYINSIREASGFAPEIKVSEKILQSIALQSAGVKPQSVLLEEKRSHIEAVAVARGETTAISVGAFSKAGGSLGAMQVKQFDQGLDGAEAWISSAKSAVRTQVSTKDIEQPSR